MPKHKWQFWHFNLAAVRLRWVVGLLAILLMPSPASGNILDDIKKACDQIGMVSGAIVAPGAPAAFGVPVQIAALNQLQSALEAALQAAKRELDTDLKIANTEVERTQSDLARYDVQSAQEALKIIDRDADADINRLQQEISQLKKEIGDLHAEISGKEMIIAEINANREAKKAPYRVRIADGKKMEKRLQSAQEKVKSLTMASFNVSLASYPARACIESKINELTKPAGNQRGDAGGGEEGDSPIDYAAVGKLGDEHRGSGGNPADSQVVKKPAGPQGEVYQSPGGGIGMIGKLPPVAWGSGMVPPPVPQGPGVGRPGPDYRDLKPVGGKTGSGSGGGAPPEPQVTSKPPAQLPPAAPTPKPLPQWVAWEAGFSIGIHVSTEEEFQDTRPVKYTGGGPEPTVVKRNKLGGPFASQQAACEWIRPKLTNVRVRPLGIGRVGTINGTEYYIGSMGCG